jgi:hypothetical protein
MLATWSVLYQMKTNFQIALFFRFERSIVRYLLASYAHFLKTQVVEAKCSSDITPLL